MKISKSDLEAIQEKLDPFLLRQESVWHPRQIVGTQLNFEFGDERPSKIVLSERLKRILKKSSLSPRGEWHLWIHWCAWRIERGDEVLAGSQDDRSHIASALELLDRKVLRSINISSPFGDTLFTFENNVTLRTFSIRCKEDEHWLFFMADGNILSLGPGSSWSYDKD